MADSPSQPHRWRKLRSEPLATTRIFDVTKAFYRHPNRDREQDFFVINAPGWVNVIALTPDHQLVLVRQFRFGIDEFSLEIPGGIIDPGEDCLAAGVRELREETGYVGDPARLLGSVHPNPAMQNNLCHLVLVDNARPTGELDLDPDEEMTVLLKPVDEVYALAYSGGITHALVLDGLLLFAPHWAKLRRGAV
jgi:8-oxo-dGTP pyrophosphatase MutT (NUDIX family)